jgi:hypothetical protein
VGELSREIVRWYLNEKQTESINGNSLPGPEEKSQAETQI